MAKSKKALKALKRRKAVKGRSRVIKQRQDYTLGGRVRRAEGGQQLYAQNKGEDLDDYQARVTASQAADPNYNRDSYQQALRSGTGIAAVPGAAKTFEAAQPNSTPTSTPTSSPTLTPEVVSVTSDDGKGKEEEPGGMVDQTGGYEPSLQTSTTNLSLDQKLDDIGDKAEDKAGQPLTNYGTRYDGETFDKAQYDVINKPVDGRPGGDTNSDGKINDEEWANWMLGKGPTVTAETDFTPAYIRRLTEIKNTGSLSQQTIDDIDAKLLNYTPIEIAPPEGEIEPDVPDTPPPSDGSLPDSPFNYEKLDINDETEFREVLLNDGKGDTFKADIPWGALTNEQQQDIDNIYNNYPYPNQERDKATAVYNYLNTQLGIVETPTEDVEEKVNELPFFEAGEIPTPEEQTIILESYSRKSFQEVIQAPRRAEFDEGSAGETEYQRKLTNYRAVTERWNRQPASQKIAYFKTFTPEQLANGVNAIKDDDRFVIYPFATIITQPNATNSGDPAKNVLRDIYNKNYRKSEIRGGDPEAYNTATTPQLDTALTDRKLDTISGAARRTTSAVDAEDEDGVVTDAVAQTEITEETMNASAQAEANYFDKYPEAKGEFEAGDFDNIFQYHIEVGKDKLDPDGQPYDLEFDTTKIAESDFTRLAEAGTTDLTSTNAAARNRADEEEAKGITPNFSEDTRSQVDPVTGETFQLASTPDAERLQRNAILDEVPAVGTEAVIEGFVGYTAAEKREVKGTAANSAAVSLLQEVGELPADIAEAILDNPAIVTAQIDTADVKVQAAIAAMPQEALVSAQLESLLAGIDEGTTPTWARPAVRLVESRLSARGLSVSTVGRDALFNAIIQTSIPMAQSNAAALQQRANQNLSNQQQANLQQSTQEMQLRLTNVANRQSAESQSATLAQQINMTQGQLSQQAQLTQSEQQQQVRLTSLQNEQQAAMANLGNDQQIELANLQVEAERQGANQSAVNQERIAEMQVSANFMQKNQEFVQQMELANLGNDQQMRLSFLTAKNQADSESLSTAQQTELANLNKRLEVNKVNAGLAQQMGVAQLNVDQQRAVTNASTVANIDLTKFSSEQQIELANSKFMQTATLQDLNNRQQVIMQDATTLAAMDMQDADALTKVSIENARNFLQKDLSNLTIEQQAFMLDSQQSQQRMLTATAAENASKQFNATTTNQTDQFMASLGQQLNLQNAAQSAAMSQFNASEANRLAAINEGNTLDAAKFTNQMNAQIDQFNTQIDFQRDQWNKQNAQAVEQSNVNWRRQTNMAETAAQNASNQLQAQQLFSLDQTEQAFLWQQLRDEATYYRQQYESEQQRKTTLYATALANEAEGGPSNVTSIFGKIDTVFQALGAAASGTSGAMGPSQSEDRFGQDIANAETYAEDEVRDDI